MDQPLVYLVYYKETMFNVTSPTTMLTFTALSLPDDVFAENITVVMTAVNKFGYAPITISNSAKISEKNNYACIQLCVL